MNQLKKFKAMLTNCTDLLEAYDKACEEYLTALEDAARRGLEDEVIAVLLEAGYTKAEGND